MFAPGYKYNCGIGYIAIPQDIEREKYIRDCFNNGHVSIWIDDGSYENRVLISPDDLNLITFPKTIDTLGSPVCFVTDERFNRSYIAAVFQTKDELGDKTEHAFSFKRKLDGAFVQIVGSAKSKTLQLIIDADTDGGELNVRLVSKNENSKINVEVQGDIEVTASGNTTIEQHKLLTLRTTDGEDNVNEFIQSPTQTDFKVGKIVVNNGEQALLLGNKTIDFLSKFINILSNSKVVTGDAGVQPLLNSPQIKALTKELDALKSKEVFIKQ